jgi:hypothetical protein
MHHDNCASSYRRADRRSPRRHRRSPVGTLLGKSHPDAARAWPRSLQSPAALRILPGRRSGAGRRRRFRRRKAAGRGAEVITRVAEDRVGSSHRGESEPGANRRSGANRRDPSTEVNDNLSQRYSGERRQARCLSSARLLGLGCRGTPASEWSRDSGMGWVPRTLPG